ncbi:MAG: phosphate regulon transcriptional regulator PhoB [Proteobacteria bacterium]|nr:phosphate regulon transcriptional regulator PhoB [Pseudomonadota bacterium]HQR04549.1 phosphate regulon transcriptional regulator PhoB [Rhodocyclaceae bacterium]
MTTRILVVEDDDAIREMLGYVLVQAGFEVVPVASAEAGLAAIRGILPDVLLVDLMLPGISGTTFARQIRQDPRTRELPLIMVTARAEEADRIAGLEIGADDYVSKPFSPKELVARIRAVLRRRAPQHSGERIELGPLCLDPVSHTATMMGSPVDLGPTEYKLLHYFLSHPGRVFSRQQLLNGVWGDHRFIEERTVDVSVRRLRACLGAGGEDLIETVRGVGYRLGQRALAG